MAVDQQESTGTFFVLPPHHRLFAVVDDPVVGNELAAELRAGKTADDVWTFVGDAGAKSLDPRVGAHGVPVAVVRVVQRLLTNDCEYCDGLSASLRHGAMVLAVRVEGGEVEGLSGLLRARGAHSFAYGDHWNFVPLSGAGHSVGFFTPEDDAAEAAEAPAPDRVATH
jgi:hypothetical protein